jgi:hypothetical protein
MMLLNKRRWFRFSLRTLFVVVTVFACWLGYELNWIRQRHAFVARQNALVIERFNERYAGMVSYQLSITKHAPFPLWLMGEKGIVCFPVLCVRTKDTVPFDRSWDDYPESREARRLFPEAKIVGGVVDLGPSHSQAQRFQSATQ